MKKFLSIALILVLVLSCAGAFAETPVSSGDTENSYPSLEEALGGLWNSLSGYTADLWDKAADFVSDHGGEIKSAAQEAIASLKDTFGEAGNLTEDILKQTFAAAVSELDIDTEGAERIWETVKSYADEHDISILSVGKLALTAVVQVIAGTDSTVGGNAEASLQDTLTQWLQDSGITSDEAADEALNDIEAALENAE